MTIDIFKDIEQAAEAEQAKQTIDLGAISRLVEKQAGLEAKEIEAHSKTLYDLAVENGFSVDDLDGALKMLKKDLFRVKQEQIPELMKEFGLDSITTSNGIKIEIKDGLSITVKNAPGLHSYLREHEAGDLIKDTVVIMVDDDDAREEVTKLLDQIDCVFERKESVHAMTLKKFIKDGLEKGERPPEDVVKLYEYRYSNIKK